MKPALFEQARPRDLASALDLLARHPDAKIIAGGQSLVPMLNLRLLQPDLVIDIAGIPELRHATPTEAGLSIGACVTHADIEDGRIPDVTGGAMARVASAIAYRAVRNRGTVGGSLCHADPAADWVSSLTCLGAEVEIASREGTRRIVLQAFVTGALSVSLQPGEMLTAVHVPRIAAGALWGYAKHCRKAGEFAHAIGAVLIRPEAGSGRAVVGAVDAAPIVVQDARILFGGRIDGDCARRFDRAAADAILVEAGMTDPVDRHLHVAVLAKAVTQAGARPAFVVQEAA